MFSSPYQTELPVSSSSSSSTTANRTELQLASVTNSISSLSSSSAHALLSRVGSGNTTRGDLLLQTSAAQIIQSQRAQSQIAIASSDATHSSNSHPKPSIVSLLSQKSNTRPSTLPSIISNNPSSAAFSIPSDQTHQPSSSNSFPSSSISEVSKGRVPGPVRLNITIIYIISYPGYKNNKHQMKQQNAAF